MAQNYQRAVTARRDATLMELSRRMFTRSSVAALAFAGYASAGAAPGSYRNQVSGYGALQADPQGFLDLPRGFAYAVISSAGEAMDDGFVVPDNFDGMGCFALDAERVALVRNHELSLRHGDKGPAGTDPQLHAKLAKLAAFGRGADGRVLPGGTTTMVWNLRTRRLEQQYLSLIGTSTNCAGGVTPWGSWLSCEETVVSAPDVQRSHGWIFEVRADQPGLAKPVPLTAMGRFRHEAAAVDPVTGAVYLTEDRDDGLLYRFLPKVPGKLDQGGRLQALVLTSGLRDARNWKATDFVPGGRLAARWIDLDGVDSPADDLRRRGYAAGATLFARGEGIHLGTRGDGQREFFFTCTSGGPGRYGQIFRYVPDGPDGGDLQLFVESTDPQLMDYADNLTVAPWGHLIVCEDRSGHQINHLRGVTPAGQTYTIARLNAATELAGACFSPDGQILFVNAYAPGRTLAIRGPWLTINQTRHA